jgi:hypothetical protein
MLKSGRQRLCQTLSLAGSLEGISIQTSVPDSAMVVWVVWLFGRLATLIIRIDAKEY